MGVVAVAPDAPSPRSDPATRLPPLSDGFLRVAVALAALAALAAAAGLFFDAYRSETDFARRGFQGPDVVTLAIAVPGLLVTTVRAHRGSVRSLLLWFGVLGYLVYTYAYVLAIHWSRLFPVYLALFSVAAFTLAAALVRVDVDRVAARVDADAPSVLTSRFCWIVAVGLGLFEGAAMVAGVVTGDEPQIVVDTAHPTAPVLVFDLGFIVPLLILAAILVGRRHPWGWVVAPIMLVKGATVGLGLLAANGLAIASEATNDGPLIVLWALIGLGSLVVLERLLRHVHDG